MAVLTGTDADSDAAVIERSLRRADDFAVIFDRYYDRIYGYVGRRLGAEPAEDIAAETFLIAFDRRGRYDPRCAQAGPWLYGIASNLIARYRRAEGRRYRALSRAGEPDRAEGFDDEVLGRVAAQQHRRELAAALAGLSGRDRDVLLLVAWAGLSCDEAAQALRIPAGTARSRLHRARGKLRTALGAAETRPTQDTRAVAGSVGTRQAEQDSGKGDERG